MEKKLTWEEDDEKTVVWHSVRAREWKSCRGPGAPRPS